MKRALYVRAVVPDYADKDFQRQRYSPWYVGHVEEHKLDDDSLRAEYVQWFAAVEACRGEEMLQFMDWLDGHDGYEVLYSTTDGFSVLPVNELLPEQERYI